MREDLIPYFGLPFYRAMIERTGFGADIDAYDRRRRRPRGDAGRDLAGVPRRAHRGRRPVGRCAQASSATATAGARSPCVGPIPGTDFDATLRAAAPERRGRHAARAGVRCPPFAAPTRLCGAVNISRG